MKGKNKIRAGRTHIFLKGEEHYGENRQTNRDLAYIITEHSYIHIRGKAGEGQLSVASNDVVENLKTLTDTIHETDVKIMAQINHSGSGKGSRKGSGAFERGKC